MENLWAPWRIGYILSDKTKGGCVFCKAFEEHEDEANFLLHRSTHCFAIMNIYPYNPGHIMIVPNRHINNISLLSKEESIDLFDTLKQFCSYIESAFKPAGLNIGMNIGQAAGAGIEDHIHIHIVPRWIGDVNFMSVISDTKVISEGLNQTYKKLKEQIKN